MDGTNPPWRTVLKRELNGDMPWSCGEDDCDYCLPCSKYTLTLHREAEAFVHAQVNLYKKQIAHGQGLTATGSSVGREALPLS
jgi:hypothetical protein